MGQKSFLYKHSDKAAAVTDEGSGSQSPINSSLLDFLCSNPHRLQVLHLKLYHSLPQIKDSRACPGPNEQHTGRASFSLEFLSSEKRSTRELSLGRSVPISVGDSYEADTAPFTPFRRVTLTLGAPLGPNMYI